MVKGCLPAFKLLKYLVSGYPPCCGDGEST